MMMKVVTRLIMVSGMKKRTKTIGGGNRTTNEFIKFTFIPDSQHDGIKVNL